MKTCKVTVLAAALSLGGIQMSSAQTNASLFPAVLHAICVSTNASGAFIYTHYSNSNILQECAAEMGVTNLAELSLVFDRTNSTLEVVTGTNDAVVCTPFTFMGGLALANSNATKIELQTYVFVGTNTAAGGLLSATEHLGYDTNSQLASFGLRGLINFSETEGTNSPVICRGVLLVGEAVNPLPHEGENEGNEEMEQGPPHHEPGRPSEDEHEQGEQGHGNNGKHLGQHKH